MISSSILTGLSLGPARCALLLQPYDSEDLQREFPSILLEIEQGIVQSNAVLPFVARSLVDTPDGLIVVGRLGEVARIRSDQTFDEDIGRPDEFGFLGEARSIGGRVYVVGMRRQVYVRDNTGRWSRADSGVLDQSRQIDRVTGFRSIDAVSANEIFAVGLDGEIWRHSGGVWRQEPSITNLILEQVRASGDGEVYIAGQMGTLIRGHHTVWSVLGQTEAESDFWGLKWFQDDLYLATRDTLLCLPKRQLPLRPVPVVGGNSFGCALPDRAHSGRLERRELIGAATAHGGTA
jgi:hypothetical protein